LHSNTVIELLKGVVVFAAICYQSNTWLTFPKLGGITPPVLVSHSNGYRCDSPPCTI